MGDECDDPFLLCTCVLVQKYIGENDIRDWLVVLCDHKILSKGERTSLQRLTKESGKENEALYRSCKAARVKENRKELLSRVFSDEDFTGDQKTAEVIQKVFENDKMSESLAWMIHSWDILESKSMQAKAAELCPGISDDDWLLDFIHHIVMTANTYAAERFVQDTRTILENPNNEVNHASSEHMEVDEKNDDGEDAASVFSESFDMAVSIFPSHFTTLNSDGEMPSEKDEKDPEESQPNQESPSEEERPGVLSMDAIMRDVDSFQTKSPTKDKEIDWEMLSMPSDKSEENLNADEENLADDRRTPSGKDLPAEVKTGQFVQESDGLDVETLFKNEKTEASDLPIQHIPVQHSLSSAPTQFRDASPTRLQLVQNENANAQKLGEKVQGDAEESNEGIHHISRQRVSSVPIQSRDVSPTGAQSFQNEKADSNKRIETVQVDVEEQRNEPHASPTQHISPQAFQPKSWKSLSSVSAQHSDSSSIEAPSTRKESMTTEKRGEKILQHTEGVHLRTLPTTSIALHRARIVSSSTANDNKVNDGTHTDHDYSSQVQDIATAQEIQSSKQIEGEIPGKENSRAATTGPRQKKNATERESISESEITTTLHIQGSKQIEGELVDKKILKSLTTDSKRKRNPSPRESTSESESQPSEGLKKAADSLQGPEDQREIQNLKDPVETGEAFDEDKKANDQDEGGDATNSNRKPEHLARSSSVRSQLSSDSSTDSECDDLDWFSSSIKDLKVYRYNVLLLIKLAWPDKPNLLDETDWPFPLMTFMEENSNKELVQTFITVCKRVIEKCQPLSTVYVRDGKESKSWLRGNSKLLAEKKIDSHFLCQLAWPSESVDEDQLREYLFAKIAKSSKKKNRSNRLNAYVDAARMLMEGKQKVSTLEKREKIAPTARTGKKANVISSSTAVNLAAVGKSKLKEFLKLGKKEKRENTKSKLTENEREAEVHKNIAKVEDKDPKQGNFVKASKPRVVQQEVESVQLSNGAANATEPRQKNEQGCVDAAEEFHDAVTDLEDFIVLTQPPTDHSFEIRVVCNDYDPNITTVTIVENLWHDWKSVRMNYNRERKFFYVAFPLPAQDFTFRYKYYVHVHGVTLHPTWEYLPSSGSNYHVNHEVLLTKDTTHIHDVPVFFHSYPGTQFALVDSIKRHAYLHLPPVTKHTSTEEGEKSYISLKKEICSFVTQMKRGWKLTDKVYHTISLSSQDLEIILLQWLSVSAAEKMHGDEDALIRILAVLNLAVVLHKLRHRIFEDKLLSFLCLGLSLHGLDEKCQKQLYQLIVQEFSSKDDRSCAVVSQTLIEIYRHLPNVVSISSPWMEWILTLPLFWTVACAGNIKTKFSMTRKNAGLRYTKAALPEADKLSWSEIQTKCKSDNCQRALASMWDTLRQVSETHPWIIGSYMYFMSQQTLVVMLKDDKRYILTKRFHIDLIIHMIFKDWKTTNRKSQILDDAIQVYSFFLHVFDEILKTDFKSFTKEGKACQMDTAKNALNALVKIAGDILALTTFSERKQKSIIYLARLMNYVAEWIYRLMNEGDDETRRSAHVIIQLVCDKISKLFTMHEDEMKFVNILLKTVWSDEHIQKLWLNLIISEVKHILKKSWEGKSDIFLEFYVKSVEKLNLEPHLEECIEEYAFCCMKNLLTDRQTRKSIWATYSQWRENMSTDHLVRLFGKLFNKEHDKFMQSCDEKRIKDPIRSLHFITKWTFASRFYQAFYREKEMEMLSTEVRKKVHSVRSSFREAVNCFCSGKMSISDTEYFVKNEKAILEFYSILISKTSGADVSVDDIVAGSLPVKKDQLKVITSFRSYIETLISLCIEMENVHVKVNIEELEGSPLMNDGQLHSILESSTPGNEKAGLDFRNLTNDMARELQMIHSVSSGTTFDQFWRGVAFKEGKEKHAGPGDELEMTWLEVLERIWPTVKDMLHSIYQDIDNGSIGVSDLVNIFGFTDGDQSLIAKEVSSIAAVNGETGAENLDATLENRCQQICRIIQLKRNEKTAGLLVKLKAVLGLTGDFQSVEIIQNMDENDEVALNDVNLDIGNSFSDEIWSDPMFLQLLEEFCLQNDLISWLKREMKDRSEVKVFCDLGMISAGETSYEVDRVSCLLSAVMGFSPLIFDLPEGAGLKEVMEKCKALRTNAESDDKLLDKWRDTGRQLAWFEGIHKFHGSVGTQSLTLAQDINKHGIYHISKSHIGAPTVENSLRLSLLMHQGEEEIVKFMSYSDLKDLQSKLMLIAGEAEQGQQDVARFNDVLSAAANLTQGYINLITGGCMLFNNWSARIICSREELVINLNFSEDSQPISTRSCLKDLELLVTVMNDALTRWSEYIERMRLHHYYLNDYNIQQITYLCEKLAKSDFTDQVYSLLSNLRRHQVCHHMQDALDEATEVHDEGEIFVEENQHDEMDGAAPLELKRRMVRELAKNGLAENLAKAAVQCEENKDVDDCENWALLNQYDDNLIEQLSNDFDEESGFGPETNTTQNFTSLLHNRTTTTLKDLITQIQEREQQTGDEARIHNIVKTICYSYNDKTSKLTLQDFLSIDHLGKFLKILREKLSTFGGRIDRGLMAPMQQGKANLILVPPSDMLYTTLSLYLYNENQPLPTRFEVLVCTEKTSADEAGRFLRRAMFKNPRKEKRLFCMVFTEKLTFNVSTHVENLFNQLSGKEITDPEYQLVILCSSTNQQHYLVTCFDRSRIELRLATERERLSQYICDKLRADTSCIPPGHDASVKLVTSKRSGVGKSLHVKRLAEQVDDQTHVTTIRLLQEEIDVDHVLQRLYRNDAFLNEDAHLIHFDLSSAVRRGIEEFTFNLLLLGSIQDSQGRVWHHYRQHFYVFEVTESKMLTTNSIMNLVPCTMCLSPKDVLGRYQAAQRLEAGKENGNAILMDQQEFQSETFQRPYQYLRRYDAKKDLDKFNYDKPAGSEPECIAVLLKHCGMQNPSWAQLYYFSSFLNVQLTNCEKSIFCQKIEGIGVRQDAIDFRGLKAFTVHFMIKMAQDFATPSLHISDESIKDVAEDAREQYAIRRRWEDEIHPFVFFNEDRATMTFINVNVNDRGDLLDANGVVKKSAMVSPRLVTDLKRQGVPFGVKFNTLSRDAKIRILCQFMNISREFDPDPTYELTTDNVLKMLAIYMRLRCCIPVIVMGETGCGKTRMIEFMSKIRSGQNNEAQNMVTLKVHGGIKVMDIYESVQRAKQIAMQNMKEHELGTILFYDEANTTSAIHAIKEVVCDLTIDGEDFRDSHLQIVAACNPYKQLSDAAVKKLEESGLGYNIKASEAEQVGRIPMRRLVYRVVALPPSMQPFVWDFGQLGEEAEEIYIRQMTSHLKTDLELGQDDAVLLNSVIFKAQCYMRKKCKDESRYVSLRDVERSLKTFKWFFQHSDHIFQEVVSYHEDRKSKFDHDQLRDIPRVLRCLIHTLSMCYHASLDDRKSFRTAVSQILQHHLIMLTESQINLEIAVCQTVFALSLKMDENIACNEALRENVFLMTVCADLRIPLFVVGKPGSSKSLAKTIVADNMQGKTSHSDLYKHFKQVHILSYQCSALTDAKGIESIFNQCAQLQSKQDLDSYAAVVVLDEVGLAEDSPNMPLKVLHPLLECGSTKNGTLTEFDPKKKVAFVGISNWALDPAKMNRGIFVTRNSPDARDLTKTAEGIFENRRNKMREHRKVIKALTAAYLQIYREQKKEYFGLRDYYSLIKMLHAACKEHHSILQKDVDNAIQRNFSGGERDHLEIFYQHLKCDAPSMPFFVQEIIQQNLKDDKSRFLLLLTNQYSSFSLLQNIVPNFHKSVQVIFGSSFPNDHSYTEMCRNINRVKVCMEAGRTVILLNMTEINESLYDALNQHYVTLGGQRYVDLGLGGHRVKCRIADGFRLIVIELKEKVYSEYPIPLINRLEKHHLTSDSLLFGEERKMAEELKRWVKKFSCITETQFTESDAFLGHNEDSVSSVVTSHGKDLLVSKAVILGSATTDAVFRLTKSELGSESNEVLRAYIEQQFHDNLWRLLKSRLNDNDEETAILMEITTFSNILSDSDRIELEKLLKTGKRSVMLLSLQQFQTEQDYLKKLDEFFGFCMKEGNDVPGEAVLLVQCHQAHKHAQLIACARYGLKNKLSQIGKCKRRVVIALLLSTQRKLTSNNDGRDENGLSLQHSADCRINYVDELRPTFRSIGCMSSFHNKTICEVLAIGENLLQQRTESDELILSIPTLLQDCICEAMTKVKSKGNEKRNLERIKILSRLCSTDTDLGYSFMTVLIRKMVEIYQEREEDGQMYAENWIVVEACSAERLQEGGTFAKTLWLCLKTHVSHLLAYIVSICDRNDNLNIIASEENASKKMHNMWLEMLAACKLKWTDMKKHKEFTVKENPCKADKEGLRIPFCAFIHEAYEQQWEILEKNMTNSDADKMMIFFKHFLRSDQQMDKAIGDVLRLPSPLVVIKSYACDLIKTFCGIRHQLAEKLSDALEKVSRQLLKDVREERLPDSVRLMLLFFVLKKYHRHLKVVNDVICLCPGAEGSLVNWITELEENGSFILHRRAIECALQFAKEKALQIKDAESCMEWMNFTRRLGNIFIFSVDLMTNLQDKQQLKRNWEPLAMLDMLFLHLLPNPSQHNMFKRYVEVVASHAKLLYKGTTKNGIRGQQFLRIVCNVLRKYFDDVVLRVTLSWQKKMCRICRKDCKLPTILPCGDYFCSACVRNTVVTSEGQKKCFSCSKVINDDFEAVPTTLTNAQEAEVKAFQANCTSFFLEYLNQFVFSKSDENLSAGEVFQLIFEELILDNRSQKAELEKAALSLNYATKSNIFSIMLRYHRTKLEEMLSRQLQDNPNDIQNITFIVMKHFELDHIMQSNGSRPEEARLEKCSQLLKNFQHKFNSTLTVPMPLEFFYAVAGVRYAIAEFVKIIGAQNTTCEDELQQAERNSLLYDVKQAILADDSGMLKEFFVKSGCRTIGVDWFSQVLNDDHYKMLIPDYLKNKPQMNVVDHFASLGYDYSKMRSDFNKIAASNHGDKVKEWFPVGQAVSLEQLLAVVLWLRDHKHSKDIYKSQIASVSSESAETLDMMCSVVEDVWPSIEGIAGQSRQQLSVLEQVILASVGAVKYQAVMTEEFKMLMADPGSTVNMFWPAMPESFYFSMPEELRYENGVDAMFQCPNGHFYTIGNCTRPWTKSICPDCGQGIGGVRHKGEVGNQRVETMDERSQAGYKLTSTEKNLQQPEDRIPMQSVSIIQMLIHICMLVGLQSKPNASVRVLSGIATADISTYLVNCIKKNIQDFSNSIGRNLDEAVLVIFKIMLDISETDAGGPAPNWASINSRKEWEKQFRTVFLLPVFQNLDKTINNAQQYLNAVEDMTSIAVFRLAHEVKEEEEQELGTSEGNWWENRCLWQIIKHPNADHLTQCIRDHPDFQTGSILQTILKNPNIELLQYLEDVLKLQQSAIERYQNRIDLADAEGFILKNWVAENASVTGAVGKYIKAWNKARVQAQSRGDCDEEMKNWFGEEMTLDSPIATVLPSRRGRGRCAKALSEYLLEMQNKFLTECFQITGLNASENEVEVAQLLHSHFIVIDKKRDLLPLIYLHTSHTIEESAYGRRHHISYNIDALEKQARENFVKNKKIVRLGSLPCIKYTQDVGIGSDWENVITKTKEQNSLSAKLVETVDDLVLNVTPAEVCEGVRTLTHAISFLAKVECDHNRLLHEYLEKDLLLSKLRTAVIPRFAKIHHTLALYQHLTWHKAVNFVQQGLQPYKEILAAIQVPPEQITDGGVLGKIKEAFEHMDVVLFQQRLNEMLIKVPDFKEDWSLTEEILPYLDFIGDEEPDDSWFDRIPEEVCFKHISHLFELAVTHVQRIP